MVLRNKDMAHPFPLMDAAVKEMNTILICKLCNQFMNEPVSLWACNHMFCKTCLEQKSICPTCGIPLWNQDKRSQQQLKDVAKALAQLRDCMDLNNSSEDVVRQSNNENCAESKDHVNDFHAATLSYADNEFENSVLKHDQSGSVSKMNDSFVTKPKSQKNKKGETPLHLAAIDGDMDKLLAILHEEVDVNCKDNAGWSPLHEACIRGHTAIVETLLDAGAYVDMPGYENETPLMDAVANNKLDTVKLLLERGADINQRKIDGRTAASFAISQEMSAILNSSISHHARNKMNVYKIDQCLLHDLHTSAEQCHTLAYSKGVDCVLVKSAAKVLRVKINKDNALNVTHFITNCCEKGKPLRTLKYLQAMSCGAWVLKPLWLEKCVENGQWVCEKDYQYDGSLDDAFDGGPLRSVSGRLKSLPRLFDSCHFFLYGAFSPPCLKKQHLSDLIKAAGGYVLTREPKPDSDCIQACTRVPYHVKPDSVMYYYTYYVVYDPSQLYLPKLIRQGKVCSVPYSWVLDCLSQFMIVDIE